MVMIPLMLGHTVICDRYVLDLMVEGMADLKDLPGRTRFGFKLLRFLPRPQQAFLVRVDPSVAFERKPDMPTLSHFRARAELYNELADSMGVTVLDGSMSPEAIHDEIWRRISKDRMAGVAGGLLWVVFFGGVLLLPGTTQARYFQNGSLNVSPPQLNPA